MRLNERLKIARTQSGFTQIDMASRLGISEGTIKRYEKDASKIPVSIVSKIALLCKADEVWLFTGKKIRDEEIRPAQDEQQIPSALTQVIIEHQNLIKKFKNSEKAKEFNEFLVNIEAGDPQGYNELYKEAKIIYKTIKRLSGNYPVPNMENLERELDPEKYERELSQGNLKPQEGGEKKGKTGTEDK